MAHPQPRAHVTQIPAIGEGHVGRNDRHGRGSLGQGGLRGQGKGPVERMRAVGKEPPPTLASVSRTSHPIPREDSWSVSARARGRTAYLGRAESPPQACRKGTRDEAGWVGYDVPVANADQTTKPIVDGHSWASRRSDYLRDGRFGGASISKERRERMQRMQEAYSATAAVRSDGSERSAVRAPACANPLATSPL